jgi:Lrp/AsnC family leucine-responsive transcriptional regulator
MSQKADIDRLDARILDILQRDGRRTYADIGAEVGISAPSVHERVKKLEARGVISGYAARVDPARVGRGILAFTWVSQAPGTASDDLTTDFAAIPEVEECHHIAGEADYLLKIRALDTKDLERVIRILSNTRHVNSTDTEIVLSSGFEQRPIPLAEVTVGDQPGAPPVTGRSDASADPGSAADPAESPASSASGSGGSEIAR